MPHWSTRRQPTSTLCVFLETSKYRVHKLWLVSCVQGLMKLEFNNVLMHHYYDLLMYSLAWQFDLSEGVHIAYLSLQYEIIQIPITQRMYQNITYHD